MGVFYIAALIVLVMSFIVQIGLKSTVSKYSKVPTNITAEDVCRIILQEEGVHGLKIQRISGELTDNYNPTNGTINLSDSTYGKSNVAAIAIAAHECGHAIQKEQGYPLYVVRQFLVPVCNFASRAAQWIALIGIFITYFSSELSIPVLNIAIFAYLIAFLFYLVLVPVEYNASNRALKIIKEKNLVGEKNNKGAKKVLRAAGRTYVIALASAALTLLRIILIRNNQRGRRR